MYIYTMPTKKNKNEKSIFILHIYKCYSSEKKLTYSIALNEAEPTGTDKPGFLVFETKNAYYQTLAEAESQIKKTVKSRTKNLYGFLIEELPLGRVFSPSCTLSSRLYLKDGSLWQNSFKTGDIVEILWQDSATLGIIWQVVSNKKISGHEEGNEPFYNVIYIEEDKNGNFSSNYTFRDASKIRPTSLPVPRKYAAELRRQLKKSYIDSLDEIPF